MTGLKQLAYAGVMVGAAFAVNPTEKYGLGSGSTLEERNRDSANSAGVVNPSDYRAGSTLEKRNRADTLPRPKPAEPMPPTSCRSVEPISKHASEFVGAHNVHGHTVWVFVNESGFGLRRMIFDNNSLDPSPGIVRVELVSLLTRYEPSVYILDEKPTAQLARQAKRRPLDQFERLSLDAVRRGDNLVWTREAPTRMFGAIRAGADCLDCHTSAKVGDLLGAFTYYLNTPVDQLYNE